MVHEEGQRTPRARRREANVERIVEAATALVAAGGVEALSMGRLAAAVDFTAGALYRYFRSKDAVLAALVARHLDEALGYLTRAEAALPAGVGALGRVAALVAGFRAFARERPRAFGLIAVTVAEPRILLADPRDAEPVAARALGTLEPLAVALGDAVLEGQLPEGDGLERTVALVALLQGLLPMQKLGRFAQRPAGPAMVERVLGATLRALLVGWGARPRVVDAALLAARTHQPRKDP